MDLPAPIPLREAETAAGGRRVAAALARRSWAVVAVGDRASRAFRACSASALEFFEETPAEVKAAARVAFADAGGLGLAGYNAPHAAKEVVRCRRGGLAAPPCPVALRSDVLAAFSEIERVAVCAWRAAAGAGAPSLGALGALVGAQEADAGDGPPSSSPFDLMYYSNGAACAGVANSTPHVDSPGLVTCVPIARTPGLRLLDAASGEWIDVERHYEPFGNVVVLAGAGLQALSRGRIAACAHAVAKGDRPRLSLVYELRPSMAAGRDILGGGA